ncbi:hypothetical protein E1267_42865 [Nonomuraea longispora]|uniref:Hydantoinase B/oxoprolinase domain-containing protein n=1 Tax=Nonomuraea longispora TaxID=1848320 RepID=A0A4R4MKE5_9ACTN|nr:hypothetical protein E1267_42865 [Nonomuraea longispora]
MAVAKVLSTHYDPIAGILAGVTRALGDRDPAPWAARAASAGVGRAPACPSSTPDKVVGDVRALVAGTAVAAARLERLIGEYGEQVADGVDAYLDHTETVTRAALAELPRGRFEASYPIDDDGMNPERPHLVRVAVTLGLQRAVLDFAGTGPQVPAAVNASASRSLAAAVFALRCFLDPSIPMNDGCLRAIDVRLPEGSPLNARSSVIATGPSSAWRRRSTSKVNNVRFAAGEAFIVETTGGGGIGPPGERDRQAILADLDAGRVTPRGAAEDYGFSL